MGGGRDFTEQQIQRYSRHILLPEVGGKGQRRINASSVFIVGAGGLGSPVALYLAAAGVGRLGLIDADRVDLSNLQRQVLHRTPDLGRLKVLSAKEKLLALNPDIEVVTHQERLTAKNIRALTEGYDILVDGSDNFATKFLLNDAAVLLCKPLIYGGILRFSGQVMTVLPRKTACIRCLFIAPPPAGAVPSCQEAGILGAVAGVIGSLQATEALKLILGIGDPLAERLLTYDALTLRFRTIRVKQNPACPVCGTRPQITELMDSEHVVCAP